MRAVRYQPAHRRSRTGGAITLLVLVLVVVVVAVAAVFVRSRTETVPDIRVARLVGSSLRFPGAAPAPAWPKDGQAAVGVLGIGQLRSSSSDKPSPIASVAKVMTAYLVLEDHPLAVGGRGFTLTIDDADVDAYEADVRAAQSTVPVARGEVLDEYQLLEALLIPSGNNIAAILARYDAGTETAFVTKMNREAVRLGLTHTTYTDPSGFATTTVSTAPDQLLLTETAIRNPVLDRIVATPSVDLPLAGKVVNFDTLLGHDGFVGVKTGSDSESGGCFVFADHRVVDGRRVTVVGAVLGLDRGQLQTPILLGAALHAALTLVQSVAHALSTRTVLPSGSIIADAVNAEGLHVSATTKSSLRTFGWGGMALPLDVDLHRFGHRLGLGQPVAEVSLGRGLGLTTTADATKALPDVSLGWRLHHLW